MLKVKVSIPGFDNNLDISQYVGNDDGIWDGCKFYVNDPDVREVDFWFVVDDLQCPVERVRVNPDCVYYLTAEVVYDVGHFDVYYRSKYLDQFSQIISCHDIYRDNARNELPFLSWMINANHGSSLFSKSVRDVGWLNALTNLEKIKELSVFCSDKAITADHRLRLKFVTALKDYFGDRLDWFGNGINALPEKWDGIAPYKYHIVLENKVAHDVITEKLYDSYLGLAFPIYSGAPNVGEYFSRDSYLEINIRDLWGSIRRIEEVLKAEEWKNNYSALLKSKNLVLNQYNPYARMARIAKETGAHSLSSSKDEVALYGQKTVAIQGIDNFGSKMMDKLGQLGERYAEKIKSKGVLI